MHRLTDFYQYIIGNIHDCIQSIMSHCNQSSLHPQRRFHIFYIINIMAQITRTDILVNDFYTDIRVGGSILCIGHIRIFYFFSKESSHFSGNTEYRLAVRTVRGNGNVKYIIIQSQISFDIFSNWSIFVKNHDSVDICSRIPVFGNSKFFSGTEHAVRHHIFHLSRCDFHAVRKLCANETGRNLCTLEDIIRTCQDQVIFTMYPTVYMTDIKMCSFIFFNRSYFTYINFLNIFSEIFNTLYFKACGKKLLFQFLRGNINIYIFF